MPVSMESLQQKLKECFPDAMETKVFDISGGCGQSFEVLIVSEKFSGKTTLARHRIVNEYLKEEIAQLHAFTQKTLTPEQYNLMKQNEDHVDN
ncbi:hypothetical protein O181_085280 [Austropuccinia psidii MF-1]|uniref:Bola-like protein n=1 Tax=Austropuccinia psidii MF-1 TaxID=1389203 RepID=A0A9Q3FRW5_9BASI|nr:hypothetical protein [Austropuccinia psidii MF-1]